MTATGNVLASVPVDVLSSQATTGPDGYLWCTLGENPPTLQRVSTDLHITTFSYPELSAFGQAVGVSTDSVGNVWFTCQLGAVVKVRSGQNPVLVYQFPTGYELGAMAFGPDGNFWVIETNNGQGAIARITPSGVVTEFAAPNASVSLGRITSGSDGNVWFTEPGIFGAPDNVVAQITTEGIITEYRTPSNASMPGPITTGPDGNIWFTEYTLGIGRVTLNPNACHTTQTVLCLDGGRFRVETQWQRPSDVAPSAANAVALTSNTGYFWFFDFANVELVAKVLSGCSTNNHYWFFGGGLTNVGVQITVTDTLSGATQHYSNSAGTPFAPIQDTAAFATCP